MSVFEKGEFLQHRVMTKNDSEMSQMSHMAEAEMSEFLQQRTMPKTDSEVSQMALSECLQQRKMPKNDRKSMLAQSEMPNSNFGIARSSSVSKADLGMRKKLSNSITNLTGKLSRSKTVHGAHGGRKTTKRQTSQKSQTDQDLDAMDDILQSISSINLK